MEREAAAADSRVSAGILILNWNGRDLLQQHLPSVMEAAAHSRLPVAVADNGSTDGSLELLRRDYRDVTPIDLGQNHGFGGGYNRAIGRLDWNIVILLNNDMSPALDFADHLLAPFANDSSVFAVSAQIFMEDASQRREETGRTSVRMYRGRLQCAHFPIGSSTHPPVVPSGYEPTAEHAHVPIDPSACSGVDLSPRSPVDWPGDAADGPENAGGSDAAIPAELQADPVMVFWLGGGSAAVSREKFLALGGFDELYAPFYMEDVDLSFRAWRRGWSTLLAPASRVTHGHRSTTGRLDPLRVETIIARNRILFVWLNVRGTRALAEHALRLTVDSLRPGAPRTALRRALPRALALLPEVVSRRRARAAEPAEMSAAEVFARFAADWRSLERPGRSTTPAASAPRGRSDRLRPLRLLFVVPQSVYPVSHGGAARITSTMWALSRRGHEVHVFSTVDSAAEQAAMQSLPEVASSVSVVLPLRRYLAGSHVPIPIRHMYRPAAHELIRDLVDQHGIDVIQLEYTQAGAYLSPPLTAPTVLVEHDLSYRSAVRSALQRRGALRTARWLLDAARFYRWELGAARRADLVITACEEEAEILRHHGIRRVGADVPNGVDVSRFDPPSGRNESRDILFLGFFGHGPNVDGLDYFMTSVWPFLAATGRKLTVTVVGQRLSPDLAARARSCGFEVLGFVEDLNAQLWSHRVFVCPIRWGAGTRIKLLEAAAARSAIVSTSLGAEGLGLRDGSEALIADDPATFAASVLTLLDDPELRRRLGDSAHDRIASRFDWPVLIENLEQHYYRLLGW